MNNNNKDSSNKTNQYDQIVKLRSNIQNTSDPMTGIYIGCVLLCLLIVFVAYIAYKFYKERNEQPRQKDKETGEKASKHEVKSLVVFDENEKLKEQDLKYLAKDLDSHLSNVDTIGFQQSMSSINRSHHSSFKMPSHSKKVLNSKVSLILLSSLISQTQFNVKSDVSSNNDDPELKRVIDKLASNDGLDKSTASKLSQTINRYYENKRKLIRQASLNSSQMSRSKSFDDLSKNDTKRKTPFKHTFKSLKEPKSILKKNSNKNEPHVIKHRRVNSEKGSSKSVRDEIISESKKKTVTLPKIVQNSPSKNEVRLLRNWKSEKRRQQPVRRDYANNVIPIVWKNTYHQSLKTKKPRDSMRPSKPTTIYELYKSNKLHVATILDSDDENKKPENI